MGWQSHKERGVELVGGLGGCNCAPSVRDSTVPPADPWKARHLSLAGEDGDLTRVCRTFNAADELKPSEMLTVFAGTNWGWRGSKGKDGSGLWGGAGSWQAAHQVYKPAENEPFCRALKAREMALKAPECDGLVLCPSSWYGLFLPAKVPEGTQG